MDAAQQLLAQTRITYEAHRCWDNTMNKRDCDTRVELLKAAAARCSRLETIGLAEDGSPQESDPLAMIAASLNDEADRVNSLYTFVTDARSSPLQLLAKAMDRPTAAIISKFSPKFASNVFVTLGATAVAHIDLRSNFPTLMSHVRAIAKFAMRGPQQEGGHLSLSQAPEKCKQHVQCHLVLDLLEKLFKTKPDVFSQVLKDLSDEGLLPTVEKNWFTHAEDDLCRWTGASYVDVSAAVLMAHVCDYNVKESWMPPAFASKILDLYRRRENVSLRLRVFSDKKKIDGTGDVGRYAWSLIEKVAAQGVDTGSVGKKAKVAWSLLKEACPAGMITDGNSNDFLGAVEQCVTDGVDARIVDLAKAIASLASDGIADPALQEAKKWLEECHGKLGAVMEDFSPPACPTQTFKSC